jgi:peptidyl-prolyl cis-trans isomerase SurA
MRLTTFGAKSRRPAGRAARALVLAGVVWWPACSLHRRGNREVWARVDGKPIYRDEVESYCRARLKNRGDWRSPQQELTFKLSILNELINHRILLDRAAAARITVTEAEVDDRWKQVHTPYSNEEFAKRLQQQGLTEENLRRQLRDDLVIEKLLRREVTARVTVTPGEIAAYYHRNQASFDVPETQYHVAQILVTPAADRPVQNLKRSDAASPSQALRKIRMIHQQLRRGADFAALAEEYSEDPHTVSGGGDMGFIPASALASDPAIGRAVAGLKVGECSGIIRDRHGDFHILKLLGRVDAGQRRLEDPQVQATIRRNLQNEKEQLLKAAYIESLRNQATVKDYLADEIVAAHADAERIR